MLEASSQHTQTLGPAPALRLPGHDEGKDGTLATLMHVSLHWSLDTDSLSESTAVRPIASVTAPAFLVPATNPRFRHAT